MDERRDRRCGGVTVISPFPDRSHLPVALSKKPSPTISFGGGAKGISVVVVVVTKTFCRNIINPLASRNADDP